MDLVYNLFMYFMNLIYFLLGNTTITFLCLVMNIYYTIDFQELIISTNLNNVRT